MDLTPTSKDFSNIGWRAISSLPKGAEKEIPDLMLSRYACYLIAQNGDPQK